MTGSTQPGVGAARSRNWLAALVAGMLALAAGLRGQLCTGPVRRDDVPVKKC